jgi:hypothetical protein
MNTIPVDPSTRILFIHYLKATAKRVTVSLFRPVLPAKCSSSSSIIKSESNLFPRHAVPFKAAEQAEQTNQGNPASLSSN